MPELAEWRPVAVVPLWRRGEGERPERGGADRPGVLRGHSGPVTVDQERAAQAVRSEAGAD
ncbi:hypothetical protein [Kitasatospora sp. NPDC086791]|uniref:hypothetical protein n=1 Tax=Kitasatospora sp. NPDC086791 TaxID=3155178 RepID=UPI003435648B